MLLRHWLNLTPPPISANLSQGLEGPRLVHLGTWPEGLGRGLSTSRDGGGCGQSRDPGQTGPTRDSYPPLSALARQPGRQVRHHVVRRAGFGATGSRLRPPGCLGRPAPTLYAGRSLWPRRDFIEKRYVELKKANPDLPILIRECSDVHPKLWARYGECETLGWGKQGFRKRRGRPRSSKNL